MLLGTTSWFFALNVTCYEITLLCNASSTSLSLSPLIYFLMKTPNEHLYWKMDIILCFHATKLWPSNFLNSSCMIVLFFVFGGIDNWVGLYSRDMRSSFPTATTITSRCTPAVPRAVHTTSQGSNQRCRKECLNNAPYRQLIYTSGTALA